MAAILILEDRAVDRTFLATLLKSAGHVVNEASDGAEGLRLAELSPPDLVISDILMPTVDGHEFVRRLRSLPGSTHTPVIFYTATYHQREARSLGEECGVGDILTKPSDPKAILAKVNAVLTSGEKPTTHRQDASDFSRDHLRVVSSALKSKVEDLEASEQRMAAIVDLAHQIAAERDSRILLNKVCSAARDMTLAQHAAIAMITDDRSAFRRVVTIGIDEVTLSRMEVPAVDSPLFNRVIGERQAVRLKSLDGRPETIGLPASHPPTHSCLLVPIASPSRVYGYLGLRNKLGANGFSDRDEDMALTLATHAGITHENAQLYDDLQNRTAALEQEVAGRRRAEIRTQLALTAAKMGVWELNLRTDRLEWSNSLVAIFGLSAAQAPTTNDEFVSLIHPEDQPAVRDGVERAIMGGTDLVNEFRAVWPDGTVHWIAGRARVLRDEGTQPTRMIGVGMDIDERKSLEEQFRQAQKMDAVGQLAGGVAHDFNNLLTVMHGRAELLLTTLNTDDRRRTDVGEILNAAERAAGLTRQLLAFSRKQVLQPTLLDMNSLVIQASKMLRRLIGENIELVTKLAPARPAVVADAGQLEQILMNLAVNARDAMPQGGRLSIETATVVLDDSYAIQHVAVRPGPYVMLAVTDNGVGMDEQTRRRLFEPFFTTKERGRGTGLGLATVYGIVKESDGYVWVYSEPGRGSTFKVYLPHVEDGATIEPATSDVEGVPSGSETVLLVEDEQAVRSLSRALLERAGYQVLDAADPREAEEVFRQHPDRIDLLVTDVIMPGSSGPALFGRLSVERPNLRVLYMSGYTDDAIVQHAGLPADMVFLQKPFTAHGLMCKVREALGR